MKVKNCLPCLASLLFVAQPTLSSADDNDSKDSTFAQVSYPGSGYAEHAPEYATAWFDFSVGCKTSELEVRNAIGEISDPVWVKIEEKLPQLPAAENDITETRVRHAGETGNISESPGSTIQVTPPKRDPEDLNKVIAGSAQRIDSCSGANLALDTEPGTVFAGSRRFGVRTSDLDWLEALVKEVNSDSRRTLNEPDSVSFTASLSEYDYGLTSETRQQLLTDVQKQAREQAEELHKSDVETLQLESSQYIARAPSAPAVPQASVGEPVKRGAAPQVTLKIPYTYSLYTESPDSLNNDNDDLAEGELSSYEVDGIGRATADYAYSRVTLRTDCNLTPGAATDALSSEVQGSTAKTVIDSLREFHGNQETTQTNAFQNNEPSEPSEDFSGYYAVEWDESSPPVVTKFRNQCSGATVHQAPENGSQYDLQPFFSASRSLVVKSDRFNELLDRTLELKGEFNKSASQADAVRVRVEDPVGAVTEDGERALQLQAREFAARCIRKPAGPFAAEAREFGFKCAYFGGLKARTQRNVLKSATRGRPTFAENSPQPAGLPGPIATPESIIVAKPGSERPFIGVTRDYQFKYRVKSANYADSTEEEGN